MKDISLKILQILKEREKVVMSDLVELFGISRQAIHRHLKPLLKDQKIIQQGNSRKTSFYILNRSLKLRSNENVKWFFKKRYSNKKLDEESVFSEITLQKSFPREILSSLRTIFTMRLLKC